MSKTQLSILLLLIAGLLYYFVISPQWSATEEPRADLATANNAVKELQSLQEKAKSVSDTYRSIPQSDLDKVGAVITSGPQMPSFIVDLDTLASQSGLALKSVDFTLSQNQATAAKPQASLPPVNAPSSPTAPTTAAPGMNPPGGPVVSQNSIAIPVGVHVAGSYDGFRKFLENLELNQRLTDVTVDGFGAPDPAHPMYDITLKMNVYYQPEASK